MQKQIEQTQEHATVEKEENRNIIRDEKIAKVENDVNELKSNVKTMSEDLKNVVSDLHKSIVEVRAAIGEIENPFNILRAVTNEEDVKKIYDEKLSELKPEIKTLVIGKPEKEEKNVELPREAEIKEKQDVAENKKPLLVETKTIEYPNYRSPRKTSLAYLDWVWSLISTGLTPNDIGQLAKSYEIMGCLPPNSSEHLHSLAVASQKAISKGFSKNRLLVNMYKAAIMSGVPIESSDILELISIAEKRTKCQNRNGSQGNV